MISNRLYINKLNNWQQNKTNTDMREWYTLISLCHAIAKRGKSHWFLKISLSIKIVVLSCIVATLPLSVGLALISLLSTLSSSSLIYIRVYCVKTRINRQLLSVATQESWLAFRMCEYENTKHLIYLFFSPFYNKINFKVISLRITLMPSNNYRRCCYTSSPRQRT